MRLTRSPGVASVALMALAVVIVPMSTHAAVIAPTPTNASACHYIPPGKPGTPAVASFSVTPSSVDVRHGAKKVTFTIKATDSTSDLEDFVVWLTQGNSESLRFQRAHGTARDGTWVGNLTILPGSYSGTWSIYELVAYDVGGGSTTYLNPREEGAEAWKHGWPKSIHVTSVWDHVAPRVVSSTIRPAVVDTTKKAHSVLVSVKMHDALTGVAGTVSVYATDKSERHQISAELKLHSGTSRDGTYTGSLRVPIWAGAGTHKWSLEYVFADKVDNEDDVYRDSLTVTSMTDPTPPVIKKVNLSAVNVDARAGGKHVTVTLRVTDTHSGVGLVFAALTRFGDEQNGVLLTRASGTKFNGVWQASFYIPRCNSTGNWDLEVAALDLGTNSVDLTTTKLKAKHFSYKVAAKGLDLEAPSARVPESVPHAGPLVLTFTEPVYWRDGTQNSTFLGLPAGTWTCKSPAHSTVTCDGASLVATASFTPTVAFVVGHSYTISSSDNIYDALYNGPMSIQEQFTAS